MAGLAVECAQLDAQIVACVHEGPPGFQLAQPLRRCDARPFPQLIAFEQQPGVLRVLPTGPVVGTQGLAGIAHDIEVANAEVAPRHGVAGFDGDGPLPAHDGLAMPPAIVEQVAQVVGGASILRIVGDGKLQHRDVLRARRKTIVWRGLGCGPQVPTRSGMVTQDVAQPGAVVAHQRCGTG